MELKASIRKRGAEPVVLLYSGGLDSTLALYLLRSWGHDVRPLFVHYGQVHEIEGRYAELHCERLNVGLRRTRVEWPGVNTPLTGGPEVPANLEEGISPYEVPGRNAVFLALGAAYAKTIGSDCVAMGCNRDDYMYFPDCRTEYLRSLGDVIGVSVMLPLIQERKVYIRDRARHHGIDPAETWSCYRPKGDERCGECDACRL